MVQRSRVDQGMHKKPYFVIIQRYIKSWKKQIEFIGDTRPICKDITNIMKILCALLLFINEFYRYTKLWSYRNIK